MNTKNMNPIVYFVIVLFLGELGIHKFIDGKVGKGILYLCTCGLFGIGWIIDVIKALLAIINPPAAVQTENTPTQFNSNNSYQKDNKEFFVLDDGSTVSQYGNYIVLEKGDKELFDGTIKEVSPLGNYQLLEGTKNDDEAVALFNRINPIKIKSDCMLFGKVFDNGTAIYCNEDDNLIIMSAEKNSTKAIGFTPDEDASILDADICAFCDYDGSEYELKVFNLITGKSWTKTKSFEDEIDEYNAVLTKENNVITVTIGKNFTASYDLDGKAL